MQSIHGVILRARSASTSPRRRASLKAAGGACSIHRLAQLLLPSPASGMRSGRLPSCDVALKNEAHAAIYAQIARRARRRRRGHLSLLAAGEGRRRKETTDEELRDELMTLLVAGTRPPPRRFPGRSDALRAREGRTRASGRRGAAAAPIRRICLSSKRFAKRRCESIRHPGVERVLMEPMEVGGFTLPRARASRRASGWSIIARRFIQPNAFKPDRFSEKKSPIPPSTSPRRRQPPLQSAPRSPSTSADRAGRRSRQGALRGGRRARAGASALRSRSRRRMAARVILRERN